jgi:hypothetical protein
MFCFPSGIAVNKLSPLLCFFIYDDGPLKIGGHFRLILRDGDDGENQGVLIFHRFQANFCQLIFKNLYLIVGPENGGADENKGNFSDIQGLKPVKGCCAASRRA